MQLARLSLSLILLAQAGSCLSIKPDQIKSIPFLEPIYKRSSSQNALHSFSMFCRAHLLYTPLSSQEYPRLLTELFNMEISEVRLRVGVFDKESLVSVLVNILTRHSKNLTLNTVAVISEDLTELYKQVAVHQILREEIDRFDFSVFNWEAAYDIFIAGLKTRQDMIPFSKTDFLNKIDSLIEAMDKSNIDSLIQFREFRKNGLNEIKNLLASALNSIEWKQTHPTHLQVSAYDGFFADILETLILMFRSRGINWIDLVYEICADSLTHINETNSRAIAHEIIDVALKRIWIHRDADVLRVGKQILALALLPNEYSKPSKSYKKFIQRKYSYERLKIRQSLSWDGYPAMLKYYAYDILHTSLYLPFELITTDDLEFLFTNFQDLVCEQSLIGIRLFDKWRAILLKSGNRLDKFYSLFNGLYDALLHGANYMKSSYDSRQTFDNSSALLNSYLDKLITWEKKTVAILLRWEPDSKYFSVNIHNNYFFYKLVTLMSNPSAFAQTGFSFQEFKSNDDDLIHELTTLPENALLMDFVRQSVADGPFNYSLFSKLTISHDILARYMKAKAIQEAIFSI